MHRNQIDALRIIRIFGPLSNLDLSSRMPEVNFDPKRTHSIVRGLITDGYVVRLHAGAYDVTNLGRAKFNSEVGG